MSSRLLEYEVRTRVHARKLGRSHREAVQAILGRIAFLELIPEVLGRAREPFPVPVRTLDALHLASAHFLEQQGQSIAIASYDRRLLAAAKSMRLTIRPLP